MKKQSSINKILCIVIGIIIIIGAVIYACKGFNIELMSSGRQKILITNSTKLDSSKIEEIAKNVLENKKVQVQKVERFGNAVEITAISINGEEKQNIISKINEELGLNISNDDINITNVPYARIREQVKPYVLPFMVTFAAVLLYFIIMYHRLGLKKVLRKGIIIPIVTLALYYSIIAITRIPYGRIVNSIAMGLYIISIGALAIYFQNKIEKLPKKDKKEND